MRFFDDLRGVAEGGSDRGEAGGEGRCLTGACAATRRVAVPSPLEKPRRRVLIVNLTTESTRLHLGSIPGLGRAETPGLFERFGVLQIGPVLHRRPRSRVLASRCCESGAGARRCASEPLPFGEGRRGRADLERAEEAENARGFGMGESKWARAPRTQSRRLTISPCRRAFSAFEGTARGERARRCSREALPRRPSPEIGEEPFFWCWK